MSTAELSEPMFSLSSDDAREMLDRQTEVLELIAGAAALSDVLGVILTSLEHLIPGARCSVLLLDRERRTLHHGAAPSLPDSYIASIDGLSIGESAGSCGTAASLNARVVAIDVRTDPRWVDFRDAALAAGMRSCWSTPIEGRDGQPVGTFAVYHSRPHRPSRREQLLVDRFTHLTAVAIDHASVLGDLVESEERFRRSFDDNSLGMAILGPDLAIATSNNALTALARRDLLGLALCDVVTPKGACLTSRLDDLGRSGSGPITFEAILHSDGHRRAVEVEVTMSPLRGPDGGPAQYLVNVFDLTERRSAERHQRALVEAESARRTAEGLSHAKSELLAAVGHEARTPIQAIVGFAELLGTIDLDEARRREALGHISAAAGHVMDLLADVLDLSRLEANALPVALEPVCVRDVVDEVFVLLSAPAQGRQVLLSSTLGDDVVRADRRRLRQVLLNLVANAIRHGNVGGRVGVVISPAPDDATVLVTVVDDGPGIPADLLPRVFTPFARAAPTRGGDSPAAGDLAQPESVGLGLGLAHGLMHAMGGQLTVGSSSSTGTAMVLLIPRATGICAHHVAAGAP